METITILKNKWTMLSRWLAMMTLALFFMSGSIQAQEVVNTNGDFSADTVGQTSDLTNWLLQGTDYASFEVIEDPDDASNQLLKVTFTDTSGFGNPWELQALHTNIPFVADGEYAVSVRAKYENAGGGTAGAISVDAEGDYPANYGVDISSGDWETVSLANFTPDTAGTMYIGIHLGAATHDEGDILYIDYMSVEEVVEEEAPSDFVNTNGDFSDSDLGPTTGTPGWFFNGTDLADFEIVEDSDDASDKLLKVKVTDITGAANPWEIQAGSANIAFEAASRYVITARMQYNSSTGASTGLMSLDPGPAAGGAQYEVSIPEGEWTVVALDTVSTDTAFTANVGLHMGFSSHANGDSTYIDYVKVQKVEEEIPTTAPEPPYSVGDNLTFNGSLTLSDLGETAPESWTISSSEGSVIEVVDDAADGDNRALSFTVSWNGSTNWYENEGVNEPVNVVEGERYRISASIKGDTDARSARLYLGMPESGSYERARGFETPQLQLSTEYQEFSFEHIATAANETNAMRVGIELNNEVNDGGVITIDDVRVTKLEHEVVEQDPIAEGKEKWLGNIYSSAQTQNFTSYWNQVTPENAGKWGSVEGTRDVMNWGGMDAAYDLAKDNGFPLRFHILIWGGQQPAWINDLSTEEQLEEIEEWMDAVAERYPDMEYVEVVNEGSNSHQLPDGQSGDANYIEALGGTGETGHDWIITSFEMARERFPNAKLMINDYNIVSSNTWGTQNARNYKAIIDDLVERDLIDVIGVQAHGFSTVGTRAQMKAVLDLLAETGLPIQATEMDIDGDPNGTDAQSDQTQLENIQRIFPTFWEHPAVEGVTLWGWRPGLWRDDQEAYLMRNNGEERPAMEWLRAYVDTADVRLEVSNEDFTSSTPQKFELNHNYPNPFNPTTNISYSIPVASAVTVNVYDITGRMVQTLVNGTKPAGNYTVTFNAANLSTGIYFYEIKAGTFRQVKKMTLIK